MHYTISGGRATFDIETKRLAIKRTTSDQRRLSHEARRTNFPKVSHLSVSVDEWKVRGRDRAINQD
jgi:hypothetical protein